MSYSEDLRKKVIEYIEKGGKKRTASQVFGIGERTIHHWMKQLKEEGHIKKKVYKTRKRKIDLEALKKHVAEKPDAYLKERAQIFGVKPVSIWHALKNLKITRKKRPKNTEKEKKK